MPYEKVEVPEHAKKQMLLCEGCAAEHDDDLCADLPDCCEGQGESTVHYIFVWRKDEN